MHEPASLSQIVNPVDNRLALRSSRTFWKLARRDGFETVTRSVAGVWFELLVVSEWDCMSAGAVATLVKRASRFEAEWLT